MFETSVPLGELAVRGLAVYALLMLLMRLSGKRTVGQFTTFDLLVVMLLSESVSNSLTGGDESLVGGLFLAALLLGANGLLAVLSTRSRKLGHLIEGSPVLIGRDGHWFEGVLKRNHIGLNDVEQALREADCDVDDMACSFLEVDGRISIRKKDAVRNPPIPGRASAA